MSTPVCPPSPSPRRTPVKRELEEKQILYTFPLPSTHRDPKRRADDDDEIEQLREGEVIAEGNFFSVRRVYAPNGRTYALKRSKRPFHTEVERDRLLHEVKNMSDLMASEHLFVVQVHRAWQEASHVYIQMELAECSLQQYLSWHEGPLREEEIWMFITDVVKGLKEVHSRGVVHLDIKPANLLILRKAMPVLKIADFGISLRPGSKLEDGGEGDSRYMAPELLAGMAGAPCDVFSLGITAYEMAADVDLPTSGPEWHGLRQGRLALPAGRSRELEELIRAMANPDPSRRPTAEALLEHPRIAALSDEREEAALAAMCLPEPVRPLLLRAEGSLRAAQEPPASRRTATKRGPPPNITKKLQFTALLPEISVTPPVAATVRRRHTEGEGPAEAGQEEEEEAATPVSSRVPVAYAADPVFPPRFQTAHRASL